MAAPYDGACKISILYKLWKNGNLINVPVRLLCTLEYSHKLRSLERRRPYSSELSMWTQRQNMVREETRWKNLCSYFSSFVRIFSWWVWTLLEWMKFTSLSETSRLSVFAWPFVSHTSSFYRVRSSRTLIRPLKQLGFLVTSDTPNISYRVTHM